MKKIIRKLFACSCLAVALFTGTNGHAQIINTFAGTPGTSGYTGDGSAATAATLNAPTYVACDHAGNVYVADEANSVIRKINTAGIITTIAGNGTAGYSGDGGLATAAELNNPICVIIDRIGNIFITDASNHLVRKIDTAGIITTIAGDSISGYSGDGGLAIDAELTFPFGVAIDKIGNIYIADGGQNVIRKVDTAGIITTIAGTGTAGSTGDGGLATAAEISIPEGVTVDTSGSIYIAEFGGNRIRKIDTSGIITTIAGDGTPAYTGDGSLATSAELSYPANVYFDELGNMYIADLGNNVIRKVNTSGIISTIAGNGTSGFSGDGGLATSAEFNYPRSVALNVAGTKMYIADMSNDIIRVINTCTIVTAGTITNSGSNAFCDSGSISLLLTGATVSDSGLINYEWESSTDGIHYTNIGTDTTYADSSITTTTYYKAIATCILSGAVDSTTVDTITVNPVVVPTVAITSSAGTSITTGETVTFTATATNGGATPTYQWQNNAVNISGATTSTYTTSTIANGNVISCIVHSSMLCAAPDSVGSNQLTMTVSSLGVASIAGSNNGIQAYPNPNNGTFNLEGDVNANNAEVEILNIVGQIVYQETIPVQNNHLKTQFTLSTSNAAGVYEVHIKTDTATSVMRVVIEK